MSKITYDNKVDLNIETQTAQINKVTASDMNEIKNVVNGNADEVGDITTLTTTDKTSVVNAINELNTNKLETSAIVNEVSTETDEVYSSDYLNDKLVSVGATAPTDGRRVWFEYSRNILPENLYVATRTLNGITYTNNGNGTISFSGTATANTSIQLIPDSKMSFKAGQPYYLYSSVPYNSTTFNLSIALTENGATRYLLANGTYTPTYNSTQARLNLYVPNGTTISATNVKLMLIEGNTAPSDYEPYVEEQAIKIDNSTFIGQDNLVSVGINQPGDGKRVWFAKGKNLYNKDEATLGTISQTDGKTISSSSSVLYTPSYIKVLPNTQYTFSCNVSNITIRLFNYTSSKSYINSSATSTSGTSTSFTTSSTTYFIRFQFTQTLNNNMQLEEGLPATTYEPYVEPSINVDGEEWYNKTFAIKTKVYPSVTTSDAGYYNLNLLCNEVAIIGMKHDPVESTTKIELYSNQLGQTFIRVSVGSVYSARTITNLTIYYI